MFSSIPNEINFILLLLFFKSRMYGLSGTLLLKAVDVQAGGWNWTNYTDLLKLVMYLLKF